ncbi:POP3 [Sanghuangporus weigelae]
MLSKANAQQKDKIARVHGGRSNRRTKDRGESKTVFRSVLTNPFEVKWPIVTQNVQDAILERVIELTQGVAEYNISRQKRTRETRAIRRVQKSGKKPRQIQVQNEMEVDASQETGDNGPSPSTSTASASALEILQHVTIGINAVTKLLEQQCCIPRQNIFETLSKSNAAKTSTDRDEAAVDEVMGDTSTDSVVDQNSHSNLNVSSDPAATRAPIRTVLVCLPDIDPPLLVAHIPYLVAACNSKANYNNNDSSATHDPSARIKLISLPKGAEVKLAQATGLRRISVLALDETVSRDEILSQHLSSVETIVAPWLMGLGAAVTPALSASTIPKTKPKTIPPERVRLLRRRLEPTHIKQLRTTAPKDMRTAKALRAKGRALAKEERKAKKKKRIEVEK